MSRGGKGLGFWSDLGDHLRGGRHADSGDLAEPLHRRGVRVQCRVKLLLQTPDLTIQQFNPVQVQTQQDAQRRSQLAAQRFLELRRRRAQGGLAERGQLLRVPLAIGQGSQDPSPAYSQQTLITPDS